MSAKAADLKLEEIRTIVARPDELGQQAGHLLEQCDICITLVGLSGLDHEDKERRVDELIAYKCHSLVSLGRLDEAEEIAAACLRREAPGPGHWPIAVLMLADIATRRGEWEKLFRLADQTEHLLAEWPKCLLSILGRRCQALKHFPERFEQGAEVARQGIVIARQNGEIFSEALFSIERTEFLQLLGRYDEARDMAEQAMVLSLQDGNGHLELHARGTLAQCCLDLGDPDAARRHALIGFERASELDLTKKQIGFLEDLAEIALVERKAAEAMAAWAKAIGLAASEPAPGKWLDLASRMREMMLARRQSAMIVDGLVAIVDSTFGADPGTRCCVSLPVVEIMKSLYSAVGPKRAGAIMDEVLARAAARRVGVALNTASRQYILLLAFAQALGKLSRGRTAEARAVASRLDRISHGVLGLQSIVDELQTPKWSPLGLGKWFSGPGRLH